MNSMHSLGYGMMIHGLTGHAANWNEENTVIKGWDKQRNAYIVTNPLNSREVIYVPGKFLKYRESGSETRSHDKPSTTASAELDRALKDVSAGEEKKEKKHPDKPKKAVSSYMWFSNDTEEKRKVCLHWKKMAHRSQLATPLTGALPCR